jgi:DNA topoisomerase-1
MQPSEHPCPQCGSPLILRQGQRGAFYSCSAYPRCRIALPVGADNKPIHPLETGEHCDQCGAPMLLKRGPRGPFLSCSMYPRCRNTRPMDVDA